jgi:DNA-binding IclR family transcriptional regulator
MNLNQTHQSLKRGLRIIEVIATMGGSLPLAEIARKAALPRSTAHHLLRALVEFGYLVQNDGARTYTLAPKLFQLTGRTWSKEQLAEIAMPFLDELSHRTGEGTSLAVLRDGVVTVIAKREPEGPVRVVQEVGARRPIYCTAVGKALAAWLPEQELDGIIRRTVFERMTPNTIPSPAAFRRELARIRAAGFAIDNEEHIKGIRCIATPVRDHSGEVRASLCVVGPKNHLPQRKFPQIRKALAAVAADLSARLGHGSTGGIRNLLMEDPEQPKCPAILQWDNRQKGGQQRSLEKT